MKHIIFLAAGLFFIAMVSMVPPGQQPGGEIRNLAVTVQQEQVKISWSYQTTVKNDYWEVQASTDNKSFHAIGLVFGQQTTQEGSYEFKQSLNKLKPGWKFFRVVHMLPEEKAIASNSIGW